MPRIVKMQKREFSYNLLKFLVGFHGPALSWPILAISLCMFIRNYTGAGNEGVLDWGGWGSVLLQLLSSHPTHKTRKRVKSNYQVSKFILVYAENGTKKRKIWNEKEKQGNGGEVAKEAKETWKTSWKPASMSCEPFGASGLFRRKMICGASALARNAKPGLEQLLASVERRGQQGRGVWERALGYPFQHFRFITIIFTLQTFFCFLLFCFFSFGFCVLFSIIYWPCACAVWKW